MSGYGVIADNIIYKDKAMPVREDTGVAFLFVEVCFCSGFYFYVFL